MLNTYCQASGQWINNDKSSVFFSKVCPDIVRTEIKNLLQVPNEALNAKYLGMPTEVGASKNVAFKYPKDDA